MIRSLPASEFERHVVVPDEPPLRTELEDAGARVHVVPMRRITTSGGVAYWIAFALAWPVTVARLALLIRRLRIDVVHTNSLHSWYGWAAALLVRRPHVWSAREIVVQSGAALKLERFLVGHFATKVVAISQAVADGLGVRDATVFSEPIATERFRPDRAGSFRAAHSLADEVAIVGAAGRIDTWKGFDVLLDAWAVVSRERADIALVVAGGPVAGKEDYARVLHARADSMPGVRWVGALDDPSDLFADLDVFVLPSTSPEPLGLVMLEALASGAPVIATDHGGPPEILGGHPERGRLVAPADARALAAAIVDLAPTASSTAQRKARTPLYVQAPARWAEVFRDAAADGR